MQNIAQFLNQWATQPQRPLYQKYVSDTTPWQTITASNLIEQCTQIQAQYRSLGLNKGDRVAICMRNSVPWAAHDLAALGMGLVVVPLYVDDNAGNMAYCIAHSGAALLIAETPRMAKNLIATQVPMPPIWVVRAEGDALPEGANLAPSVTSNLPFECQAVEVNQVATICYTSGTGGKPKGVMLSHRNIVANVESCLELGIARADDTFLSFLPLSHMFERTGGYYLPLAIGACVAHARSVATIADDLQQVRPTALFAVPRIFEKFYARIASAMNESALKAALFKKNVEWGWKVHQKEANVFEAIGAKVLSKIVGQKVLARLGGRLRLAVAGGAALEAGIAKTFIGLGLPILHGYGMTEASPVICVNRVEGNVPASVGAPMPGVEVRIAENGELQAKGDNAMMGYWQDSAATEKAIGADGWLHTGDIGEMIDGKVYIRGRIKDILVLSNGEKCPPQDMELAVISDPAFEQIMLVGEGKPFLSLIVVSQETDEKALLKKANDKLKDFPKWMRIRKIIVSNEAWTVDNEMLTPTMKVKRAKVLANFAPKLDAIYSDNNA